MPSATKRDWVHGFGLENREPPYFISTIDQVQNSVLNVPQPQTLHSAFELLEIDGVLCIDRNPTVYFKQLPECDPSKILELHKNFWNQGIAPLLVIISPEEVHIYSGLVPPAEQSFKDTEESGLIEKLPLIEEKLRSFILSVETGEYFRVHTPFFNPEKRVDRSLLKNLRATREKLEKVSSVPLEPQTLDALLCRLIFTCYLFDRGIIDQKYLKEIDIHDSVDLKTILAKRSKSELYTLFRRLKQDFNGDLFTSNLDDECRQIKSEHMAILDDCFNGHDVETGQLALFSMYDFRFIPIETISAIYEHFLKVAGEKQKRESGAFYTPRFLAEFVIDNALEGETSLLEKRFLDPACGSGIFLVGLFNRLAHEWKLKNPGSTYQKRARGLMDILTVNIFGVDKNPSACNITAFSLYLAFLDQLSPPDIRKLLVKWDRLPNLVYAPDEKNKNRKSSGTIRCADFFTDNTGDIQPVDILIGNPPWGSEKNLNAPIVRWCTEFNKPLPDQQMAVAFIWKAALHLNVRGKVCFVLPHGVLFNHGKTAIQFQQTFFRAHTVERVINLTDYQFFLFEESRAPAVVIRYTLEKPQDSAHKIEYWAPKTDWTVRQAESICILPQDRSRIFLRDILEDMKGMDAPLIWKKLFWATPRDRRLIERLSLFPRLRDHTRQVKEKKVDKPWLIAQGFQPTGPGDSIEKAKTFKLPTKLYIEANRITPFITKEECQVIPSDLKFRRGRSDESILIFQAPHVLITRGFSSGGCAFTDLPLTFRSSVRGIHGPENHRELLIFLSFYLRSALARYFLFHTSSNWGVTRAEVQDQELMRVPFPFPDQCQDSKKAWQMVRDAATIFDRAYGNLDVFSNREGLENDTQSTVEEMIYSYFDIDKQERKIIEDTVNVFIPSFRPSRSRQDIPALQPSTRKQQHIYLQCLCSQLNEWASREYKTTGNVVSDSSTGIGLVVLEKIRRDSPVAAPTTEPKASIVKSLAALQKIVAKSYGTYELVRGLKVFHKNKLYITKPLGQRFWTYTAALNDADEIAATILTRPGRD